MNSKLALQFTAWFKANARPLPWRAQPEPYAVWISEIMLQQTQVATVLPYYARFMKSFPTVKHLAKASLDEVYAHWAGLGYYSRARNLHLAAKAISERKIFPRNRDEWLEVPGVGEYTAGAICSIAMNQREPIVDGNVERVLSRIYALQKRDPKRTEIWRLAKELVETKAPGVEPRDLNQSLMELGATVCKPKNPDCKSCPVSALCKGKKNPLLYPEPKVKKTWKIVNESRAVFIQGKKIFLVQNEKTKWREGLWDFPESPQIFKLKNSQMKLLHDFTVRYVVTDHKVKREHQVFQIKGQPKSSLGSWFALDALPGIPAPVKKAILALKQLDKK